MAYYDGFCDECGGQAELITPMYCLCVECFDGKAEQDDCMTMDEALAADEAKLMAMGAYEVKK